MYSSFLCLEKVHIAAEYNDRRCVRDRCGAHRCVRFDRRQSCVDNCSVEQFWCLFAEQPDQLNVTTADSTGGRCSNTNRHRSATLYNRHR